MILTLFYFIIALALLVIVHEYGHFITARCCGIHIVRFSLGFGKVLCRWQDKKGTEYVISALPLGGYVKMLDETEQAVTPDQRHLAFNNKPVVIRMAVVIAGPLFNFLFALLALWVVQVMGVEALIPVINTVTPGSLAAKAGLTPHDEIKAVNGTPIFGWRDFQYALMPYVGSKATLTLTVQSSYNAAKKNLPLSLEQGSLEGGKKGLFEHLGIVPFIPELPAIVGEVKAASPAEKGGLQVDDVIKKINGNTVKDWQFLVSFVKKHPDQRLTLQIERQGKPKVLSVTAGSDRVKGRAEGFLGVVSKKTKWPQQYLRMHRQPPLHAAGIALKQTVDLTVTTFVLTTRLIVGKLALNNVSGPLGIAQGAGEAGRSGLVYYLSFLALVSISLGVLNLLPVPMLDGGHLLYDVIAIVRGRALSLKAQSLGMSIGFSILAGLMVLAIANDLVRLWR